MSEGKIGSDLYADGTSTTFGGSTPIADTLAVFTDVFAPYAPPPNEAEAYYSELPFVEAERKLAETAAAARPVRSTCGWHGLLVDRDRGAVVLARAGGAFEDLIGQRVRISSISGENTVVGFVRAVADLDDRQDLSVPRRMFLGLSLLGHDRIPVLVERLK